MNIGLGNEKVEVHLVTPEHSNCHMSEQNQRHGPCPNCGSVDEKTNTCPANRKCVTFATNTITLAKVHSAHNNRIC